MQLKQTKSETLFRSYDVTVPANDIEQQLNQRLNQLSKTIKMPGFRPGKVPVEIVKKQHGKNVMGEVLEKVVDQTMREAIEKEKLKPATQPKVEIKEFDEGKDLVYSMDVELLPDIPEIDFSKITVERPKIEVKDEDIQESLENLAQQAKQYEPIEGKRAAKKGDAVKIDFKGFIGDEAFEGGQAEGHQLVLGSNSFIPGFEDQLTGAKAGEEKEVKVSFPEDYHADHLAGKEARFEVKVHEILAEQEGRIDDELAKRMGLESLDSLKEVMKQQMQQEADKAAHLHAKKELFDELDALCDFPIPEGMEKNEFDAIWQQLQQAKAQNPDADEFKKPEKELKAEYEEMAKRRVRLGILLAELGGKYKLQVTPQELQAAVNQEVQRYPGQEQQVMEFLQKNPQQLESFKGPILEEKVVNKLFEEVTVKEKPMTVAELQKLDEAEEAPKKKPSAKKAGEKKSADSKKPAGKSSTTKKDASSSKKSTTKK